MNRNEKIVKVAMKLCEKPGGWINLTREQIGKVANVNPSLVPYYFGNMKSFKDFLMQEAIDNEVMGIIVQGLVVGNSVARKAPEELKIMAVKQLLLA